LYLSDRDRIGASSCVGEGRGARHELLPAAVINGISLGAIYGLIAIGYTMVYGIIGMINFAHGDILLVGAFISLCF